MQVILLERVDRLGGIGDEVSVKNGFARNFLLPQGKALLANDANRRRFEAERVEIEARNARNREAASQAGEGLDGESFIMIRQAGETGVLYGSVAARDIVEAIAEHGHKVERRQVELKAPIKTIGTHEVPIRLHPEVSVTITMNVARSPDEAERQAAGENIIETSMAEGRALAEEQASELAEAAAEADFGPAEED